jgi:hypothetical protein
LEQYFHRSADQLGPEDIRDYIAHLCSQVVDVIGDLLPVRREELRPELLEAPCAPAGIALSLRYQPGYDTSTIISARSSGPITLPGMRRDCEGDRR